MKWVGYLLLIALSGCAMLNPPRSANKKTVHRKHEKVKHATPKPKQTPVPKMSDLPPFPPPNYDEVIRRTHPTPTISPYDFQ